MAEREEEIAKAEMTQENAETSAENYQHLTSMPEPPNSYFK